MATYTNRKNTRFGVDPVTASITAISTGVKALSALQASNKAKAQAKDVEDQNKAYDWLINAPMGSRDKTWGAEYIAKLSADWTIFDPYVSAQAWAYVFSNYARSIGKPLPEMTIDPYNEAMQQAMTADFPTEKYSDFHMRHAKFIVNHPEYHNQTLINYATAFVQSNGKTYDLASLTQPAVSVPSAASSPIVPVTPSAGVVKASLFSGSMPLVIISGAVVAVVYKLFIEKKHSTGRRKR